jgi:cytochrome c oxidase subunit 2
MMFPRALPLLLLVVAPMAACGGNGGGPDLSAEAQAGRSVFRDSGCASCHGANGQGGVGPQLAGLWGTEVTLDDGTTVIADEAYIRESIVEPSAKKVDGYRIPMPANDLDDAEVASILDYIEAIGPTGADE